MLVGKAIQLHGGRIQTGTGKKAPAQPQAMFVGPSFSLVKRRRTANPTKK